MRFLIEASWDTEAGDKVAREGNLRATVRSILDDLEPEAAYFVADNGKRTAFLVLDTQDASRMPAVAEPWFLALNASVECQPAMIAEDLEKAGPAIEQSVKKYG